MPLASDPMVSLTDFGLKCVFSAFDRIRPFFIQLHSQTSAACAQRGCEVVLGGRLFEEIRVRILSQRIPLRCHSERIEDPLSPS